MAKVKILWWSLMLATPLLVLLAWPVGAHNPDAAGKNATNTFAVVQTFDAGVVISGGAVISGDVDTTISSSGTTTLIDTPSASTITYSFTNSGVGVASLSVDELTLTASATPTSTFDDSDDAGAIDASIVVNCPTTNDCDMDFKVDSGSDTAATIMRIDTTDAGVSRFHIVPLATKPAACVIGDFYVDTSGAYCTCSSANAWTNTNGVGDCDT